MAKILIPTALRQFTEQSDSVDVTGATVRDALDQLTARYPNIKKNPHGGASGLSVPPSKSSKTAKST